jgi:hypothetical protein
MAMIKCEECEQSVSSKAAACPGCGAPIAGGTAFQTKQNNAARTVKLLSFLAMVVGILGFYVIPSLSILIFIGFFGFVVGRFME